MTDESKPCPFCGDTELVPSFHTAQPHLEVAMSCGGCDAEGPRVFVDAGGDVEQRSAALMEALKRWNIRKP